MGSVLESAMRAGAPWRRAWLLGTLAVLGACANPTPAPRARTQPNKAASAAGPEIAYLSATPYRRLVIEVDRVEGTPFRRRERALVERFCARCCDKPGGIEVRLDAPVPRDAVAGEDPALLLLRRTDGPGADDGHTAYLHVLVYDSRLEGRLKPDPIRVLTSCPTAVLIDRAWLRARVRPTVSERTLLGVALVHGLGRAFGLRGRSGSKPPWCAGGGCVMDPAIFDAGVAALFLGRVSYDEPRLCAPCREQLAALRGRALARGSRFRGPVWVRAQRGYFVASLPFYTWLGWGDAAALEPETLRARAIAFMEARPSYHRRARAYVDAELPWPLDAERRAAIERALARASRDRDRVVARLARLLQRSLHARLREAGNGK